MRHFYAENYGYHKSWYLNFLAYENKNLDKDNN